MRIQNILIKPKVTEKSLANTKLGIYAFEVATESSKNQVKKMIEDLFKVHVTGIRSTMRIGKIVRVGKRMRPKSRPNRKIMHATLRKGERIELFPS